MKKDKIHYSSRKIDSYNLVWNFIISEREAGKTTAIINKAYKIFKTKHRATLIIRRLINDITDTYITDLGKVINKFLSDDKKIKLEFKKGSIKEGVVDVFIDAEHFLRVIALSNPASRVKSTLIEHPGLVIFDEFICNTRMKEKYLDEEAFKFKEIYNTYQRECDGYKLKCYFIGNPYSLFNPYFSDFDVDTSLLRPGAFIVNKKKGYAIECYQLTEELRKFILERNPLYQFDDSYTRYAFNGIAVNDSNIKIVKKQPTDYKLKFIFRINHKYLGIYINNKPRESYGFDCGRFWVGIIDYAGANRKVYAVDFNNLVNGSQLITTDLKALGYRFKNAIGKRDVSYQSIECSYLSEEIYQLLK